MFRSSSWGVSSIFAVAVLVAAPACNDSKGYHDPSASSLRIVSVSGPRDNVVTYDPASNSGACPFSVNVTFRLAEDQFVSMAYVRFQGDGQDDGIDRGHGIVWVNPEGGIEGRAYGAGSENNVTVRVDTAVPPAILRTNAQFTYSVRIMTGAGDESPASTLTLTVQEPPQAVDGGADGG